MKIEAFTTLVLTHFFSLYLITHHINVDKLSFDIRVYKYRCQLL